MTSCMRFRVAARALPKIRGRGGAGYAVWHPSGVRVGVRRLAVTAFERRHSTMRAKARRPSVSGGVRHCGDRGRWPGLSQGWRRVHQSQVVSGTRGASLSQLCVAMGMRLHEGPVTEAGAGVSGPRRLDGPDRAVAKGQFGTVQSRGDS